MYETLASDWCNAEIDLAITANCRLPFTFHSHHKSRTQVYTATPYTIGSHFDCYSYASTTTDNRRVEFDVDFAPEQMESIEFL